MSRSYDFQWAAGNDSSFAQSQSFGSSKWSRRRKHGLARGYEEIPSEEEYFRFDTWGCCDAGQEWWLRFLIFRSYQVTVLGTIHVVVTIDWIHHPPMRSSLCTDVAKIIEAPIFHVNGNDPMSVAMVAELA